MADDIPASAISWVIGTVAAGATAVMAFLMRRAISRLDDDLDAHEARLNEHDKQHNNCSLDLANFRTEVAKDYAKDATVQASLSRIHDRIDEVATDIKTLLGRK